MKKATLPILLATLISCNTTNKEPQAKPASNPLIGTWKLLSGTLIENGDTTVTDYTKNMSFIKIINNTHFAFLQHNTNKKDSSVFVAGGGPYTLKDSTYTEHLQYCSDRAWEGNNFPFTITIKNDTLTQYGIEKVPEKGINRLNIEKYLRQTQ